MAGKHRADSSDSSNRVATVAGLAGIAVAASLLTAGTAGAGPLDSILKPGPAAKPSSPGPGLSSLFSPSPAAKPSLSPGATATSLFTRGFFTAPDPAKPITGFGPIIKTPGLSTTGIPYVTAPGPIYFSGFCLNARGCN
jgi:hypothetical protein